MPFVQKYKKDLFFQSRIKFTVLMLVIFAPILFLVTSMDALISLKQTQTEYAFLEETLDPGENGVKGPKAIVLDQLKTIIAREVLKPSEVTFQKILPLVYILDLFILLLAALIFYRLSVYILDPIQNYIALSKGFISNASHELKTPLAVIKSEIGVAKATGEIDKNLAKSVLEETDKMSELISNMLSLHKLTNSNGEYVQENISVIQLLEKIATDTRKYAETRDVKIVLDSKLQGDEKIHINEIDVSLAIKNIVRNAVDFSPKDSNVELNVYKDGYYILLDIVDHGTGIKKESMANIFKPFFKSRLPENGSGHGLGLAIANEVCKNNSIILSVDSVEGSMTKFTLKFNKIKTK